MKPLFVLLIFLCCYFKVNAQAYAIIDDKNDFVNMRKARSAKSAIIARLYRGDLFGYDPYDKSDWVAIYKQQGRNKGIGGYIHRSKLLPLSKLRTLGNKTVNKNWCSVKNDGLIISVRSSTFKSHGHKFTYENTGRFLEKIDGKEIWGTDGGMPTKVIKSISVIKNGRSIFLPKWSYNDLYQPSLQSLKVFITAYDTLYIQMDNSDGAGGYSIIWVIRDGKYLKRYIDNSEA